MKRTDPSAAPQPSPRTRRLAIAPQMADYAMLKRVLWPYVNAAAPAGYTSEVVSIDSRGHRVTRLDGRTVRSDSAPEDAAFLLGGSFSFGVGASGDSGTLAAQLWRRTGRPYVNLGVRAGVSAQELISALPFVDRTSVFVVCSGLNNVSLGLGGEAGIDPLFGPMYHETYLRRLTEHSISTLGKLAGDPLGRLPDGALRRELRRRRRARMHERLRPVRRLRKRVRGRLRLSAPRPERAPAGAAEPDRDELVVAAAARQIRDLGRLRRLSPSSRIVFALQPTALSTEKDWTPEETELFALNDALQTRRWERLKEMLETTWATYASTLEAGCAGLEVPFVDLSAASYDGWCFVDRAHMTDRGYAAAADFLVEVAGAACR